jgi:vacuolar-type H+-ATPase catalytic subunit A/Vma1
MTKEESWNKWRGRFLLFMTEAWACRKAEPSTLGLLADNHLLTAQRLHDAIFDSLRAGMVPAPVSPPPAQPARKAV